ncbi:MAG TPA: hypothetical protein VF323_10280 [Candidatus Limnocylindrales bacterium]
MIIGLPADRALRAGSIALAAAILLGAFPPGPVAATSATSPAASATTLAGAASSIVPGRVDRTSFALVGRYSVSLGLRFDPGKIDVFTGIDVRNASSGPIDRLELNTIAARVGQMRLGTVSVDGRRVPATVDDQTIVVPLGGILPPGASTFVRVHYSATLRRTLSGSDWLFAKANGIVDLYRWIPWLSLRRPFDRPNNGDPFLTVASPLVRVTIATDRPLVVAATGRRVAKQGLVQTFEARDVRDMTITASPFYRRTTTTVGSTTIQVYAKPGFPAATVRGYARTAIARMGALAGAYPYATYTIAQSAGGDGMESPELSWIPAGPTGSHLRWLVTHETAHQWFYGLVGNDQARQPFADEAMADELARYVTGIRRASRCPTGRLDRSIYAYSNACYFEVVYVQGSTFLDGLRKRMGNAAFWSAVRGYVAAHRLGIATTKQLLTALDDGTPLDLRPLLHTRFPSLF